MKTELKNAIEYLRTRNFQIILNKDNTCVVTHGFSKNGAILSEREVIKMARDEKERIHSDSEKNEKKREHLKIKNEKSDLNDE